jgi:hypothetical protein
MGPSERQFVNEDEIPSDYIQLDDGTVLAPTPEGEDPEFFQGPDGMIYPIGAGIPVEEHDESDNDVGFYVEEHPDFEDEGVSRETDPDDTEGWDDEDDDYYDDDED